MAGWGYIDDETRPMILKTGLVKLISLPECIKRGQNSTGDETFDIPPNYFCSVAEPWILANCVSDARFSKMIFNQTRLIYYLKFFIQGDSGGPTLNENNELVAITKGVCPLRLYNGFSDDFRDSNLMNVHLNLLRYRRFIEAVAVQ